MQASASRHPRSERHLAANGHECYELPAARPSFVPTAIDLLSEHHGFQLTRPVADGFDEVVAHVHRGDIALYVAWDNWTGFDILSLSDAADSVVRELATYFDAIKDDDRFAEHFDNDRNA